jgi:hypothetical protein
MGRIHLKPQISSAILIAGLAGCFEAPKEPVAPTTDVQLSVPIANRVFLVGDFAQNETLLTPTGDGGFLFQTSGPTQSFGVNGFEIELDTASAEVSLGSFVVDDPPPSFTRVTYREITGFDPPPVPTPAPEASYTVPGTDIGPTGTFETVTFESGSATLRIRNTLPMPVDFPEGVRLRNNRTTTPVDTSTVVVFSFGGRVIQPGEQDSSVVDLAGMTLQTLLRIVDATLHTSGSGGVPVSIGAQDGVELRLIVTGLRVSSALALIPNQTIVSVQDSVVALDDSVSLQDAAFKSGSFSITLENTIDATVTVSVQLNELKDRSSGAPFVFNHQFDGPGVFNLVVDMRTLILQSPKDTIGTYATFSAGIGTIASQTLRQVNSTDVVKVRFDPTVGDPVMIESLTGRITPTTISARQGSVVDLGELNEKFLGTLTFDSIMVGINMEFTSGFPFDYDLRLVGLNRQASPPVMDSIVLPPPVGSSVRRIFPIPGQTSRIEVDLGDGLQNFLNSFSPNFPDSFIVSGSMLLNPPDVFPTPAGRQTIYDTSRVYTSFDLSFPLNLGILGGEVQDTVHLHDGERLPNDFIESSVRGTVFFQITNAMPLGLSFRAAFLQETSPGVFDTLLWVPSNTVRTILTGSVDPATGVVVSPTVSAFDISLPSSDMQLYNQSDVLYFQFGLETANGGTVPVKFTDADFIRLETSANIVYRLE